jgi:hypothetical protein
VMTAISLPEKKPFPRRHNMMQTAMRTGSDIEAAILADPHRRLVSPFPI